MFIPRREKLMFLLLACAMAVIIIHVNYFRSLRSTRIPNRNSMPVRENKGNSELMPKYIAENEGSTEQVSKARLEEMDRACKQYHFFNETKSRNLIINENLQMGFCAIQKTGSTFWKRALEYCGRRKNYTSLFSVQWNDMKTPGLKAYGNRSEIVLNKSTKFLFVRNPYMRLFSGYIDKLFAPNPAYWGGRGKLIKKFINGNRIPVCGHDVTFSQFVKHFIHSEATNEHRDGHFTPMHQHCSPCKYTYDFLGTMETFATDAVYLLKKLTRRSPVKIAFEDFQKDSTYDSLHDHADRLYKWKGPITKCLDFYSAMWRTWRNLQGRGHLGKNVSVPFTRMEADTITMTQFEAALIKAYKMSGSKSYMKANKIDAVMEAYSTVPMDNLEKLRRIFRPDCLLFGYHETPVEIFELSRRYSTKSFSFFDV